MCWNDRDTHPYTYSSFTPLPSFVKGATSRWYMMILQFRSAILCWFYYLIHHVMVFDAILTSRQTCDKLQCLYENLMSNNFPKAAVLKETATVKRTANKATGLLVKQQLCTCITLFCTFLSRGCTTATWNFLISCARALNLDEVLSDSPPENVANIWQICYHGNVT